MKLSPQHKKFADGLLTGMKATEAAKLAGYSQKTAKQMGSRLQKRKDIKAYLAEKRVKIDEATELDRDGLLRELEHIILSDPRQFYDENGQMLPMHKLSNRAAASIASLEVEELYVGRGAERESIGQLKKLKRWDKNKAIELHARIKGYFAPQKIEHDAGETFLDWLKKSSQA